MRAEKIPRNSDEYLADLLRKLPSQEEFEKEVEDIKSIDVTKKSLYERTRRSHQQILGEIYEEQTAAINELIRRKIINEHRLDILAVEVLGYKYEDFHAEMSDFQNRTERQIDGQITSAKRSGCLAPRGSGKTHILTYTQVIFEVLKDPNIRILITSNTQSQADSFLRTISQHLLSNEKLIAIFGPQKHPTYKWDTREINLFSRTRKGRESTVTCIGLGGAMTGLHFDLIIADDLVDEESARTRHQRTYCIIWFYKTLYPTLESWGRLYVIGTPYHPNDLYAKLQLEEFSGHFLIISCLIKNSDGSERSYWPEVWSVLKLHSMRRAMGIVIFNTQMMCNTDLMVGRIIKAEMFKKYKTLPDVNGFKVSGVDSAVSDKDKDDYFAHVTIFVTREELPRVYLVSYTKRKISPSAQYDLVVRKNKDEEPIRVFIESNAGQAYFAEGCRTKGVPVKKIYSLKDKVTEFNRISPTIEDNRFYIKEEHADFVNDIVAFPDGDDDDIADALRQAMKGALFTKIKKRRKRKFGVI